MALERRGYTDDLDVDLRIDGDKWHLLQSTVELTTASTPDYVTMVITPTSETVDNLPANPTLTSQEGGLLGSTFTLDIDTELSAGPRGDEITRIFTGNLANLSVSGQGAWEAIAWDPSHQSFASGEGAGNEGNFLNSKIDLPAATGAKINQLLDTTPTTIDYDESSTTGGTATKVRATELVEKIIEQSPLDESQTRTNFASGRGVEVGTRPDGTTIYGGIDRELYFSNDDIKVSTALEAIENSTNSTWWFDREGVFNIGAPVPGNPIESWNLQFIIETSAGKSTPAWKGVQVIGSGVVSEDGWSRTNMNTSRYTISDISLASDGKTDTDKLAEPVYTYRNLEIQTQAEADSVAEELVNKLRDQQAEGKVRVVGFPEIRPLDAIQMPQSTDDNRENFQPLQPMGGERYGVVKVVHNINPDDGFITDIHVGGLTKESATVYNDEVINRIRSNVIAGDTTEGLASGSGI